MPFDANFFDYVLGRSGDVIGNLLGSMAGSPGGVNFDALGSSLTAGRNATAVARTGQAQQDQKNYDANKPQPTPQAHPGPVPGHDTFMDTSLPLAQQVEAATGVPAALSVAIAANETGHGAAPNSGAPWNSFHGIRGTGSAGQTPAGFRAYNNAQESYADFAKLITDPNSPYAGAWAQYQQNHDPRQLLQGIAQAGYASSQIIEADGRTEAQNWVDQVGHLMDYADQTQSAHQRGQVTIQGTSQYDLGLPRDVADAFCGPAAAMEFARHMGRTPTALEAMNMAKEVGWTVGSGPNDGGMAGPQSEVALLNRLGVPAYSAPPDPQKIAQEIQAGRPVIIDAPGHYYQITGYNANTGTFTFGDAVGAKYGTAGLALDQLPARFGPARTAIYMGTNNGPQ